MQPRTKAYLAVHLSAVVFGGTALCAKIIPLNAVQISFWRSVFALGGLFLLMRLRQTPVFLQNSRDYVRQIGLGGLLILHWATYFHSIQISTVAVGLVALFTAPMISVLLEPLLHEGKLDLVDILLGLLVLAGVYLLVPDFNLGNNTTLGVIWGLASALALSLRNILHRRYMRSYKPLQLLFYQVLGCILFLSWVPFTMPAAVTLPLVGMVAVLGLVFTALPHGLIVVGLQILPAKSVLLVTSCMVVYGGLFAWIILHETPTPGTILGGVLIMGSATVETLRKNKPPVGTDT